MCPSARHPFRVSLRRRFRSGACSVCGYTDRDGRQTVRDVEPLGYIRSTTAWYLLGWCRMRDAPRAFRFDRIDGVTALSERVSPRALSADDVQVPEGDLRSLTLL